MSFPGQPQPTCEAETALIIQVTDGSASLFHVRVAYGTSQRTTTLHRGEFSILYERNRAAFQAAGLKYDTKLDLGRTVNLPYTSE